MGNRARLRPFVTRNSITCLRDRFKSGPRPILSGLETRQPRDRRLWFVIRECDCGCRSSCGTRLALNLVLDVPIQSQLAGVEDIAITHFDAREEVIFGSSSLSGITLSRVVCSVR